MIRALGYLWCLPVTLAGCLLCLAGDARPVATYRGALVFVAHRGFLRLFFVRARVAAFAWGGCICVASPALLKKQDLLRHEHRHFMQASVFGVLMPLAYGLASLWAVLRGGHAYRDNWFERDARRAAGEEQ